MHRYYCSYFDRNYLLKAIALINSLNRHCATGFTLYAVCLDEITRVILERLALPNVVTVPLHRIEENDADLLAAKGNRSVVEYYWTLTPSVMLRLLDWHPEIELITYIDADLYFYADPEPIFAEMGEASTLIHGHRFPEQLKHLESFGKYNVGLLCFRRDAEGMEVLRWWRERCNEWCYCEIDNGRYGDQLYLDDWPTRFRKVHVLEHIGAGVAPWNHIQYRFWNDASGRVRVDDREVIFYHFHSLDLVRPWLVVPAKFVLYPLREDIIRCCIMPYVDELCRAMETVLRVLPSFAFGMLNDKLLTAEQTLIVRKEQAGGLERLGLAHPRLDLGAGWECHSTEQMHPAAPPYPAQGAVSVATPYNAQSAASVAAPEKPRLSVVVPSYNYGRYLEACLDSILSQGYPNLELLVLDGGSTDNTVEILKRYEKHLAFWRSSRDDGQYAAIEEGLNRSTGAIMTWLNADDMFHPGAFDTVSRIFTQAPEVEWLMGRPNSFDEAGGQKQVVSYLPLNSRAKYLADEVFIQQEGVFWRRALWERSGARIDRTLSLAADLELWARFFRSARLFSVDRPIAGFRDHPLQKSKNQAAYSAEAGVVLAREKGIFTAEATPFNPPAPLPILVRDNEIIL